MEVWSWNAATIAVADRERVLQEFSEFGADVVLIQEWDAEAVEKAEVQNMVMNGHSVYVGRSKGRKARAICLMGRAAEAKEIEVRVEGMGMRIVY